MFSSKLEIINHFDNLVNRVDIDIEECLENYNQEQVLGDLSFFLKAQERNFKEIELFELTFFKPKSIDSYQRTDLYSESTKVVDYLNQIRMRTIDELRKAQEDTLKHYKLNKTSNNQLTDELKSQKLSPDKFYFQVLFKPSNEAKWIFNLFTFVTDFYISPVYIDLFEKLINDAKGNYELFSIYDSAIFFDEKMVLIGLLQKHFFENLQTKTLPSHVIRVCKQDALNIKEINFSYDIFGVKLTDSSSLDLSNLEALDLSLKNRSEELINIEGLSSLQALHLTNFSLEQTSLNRLNSLRELSLLRQSNSTNLEHLSNLFEFLPNIEKFYLSCDLSYINLDSLFKLKTIVLLITKTEFNVDVFNNISHQLEEIVVNDPYRKITHELFEKLFFAHRFPNLLNLVIFNINVDKLEKKLFAGFPILQKLEISQLEIRIIDNDAFSYMKQLTYLKLTKNCIESINQSHFLDLINLESLYLDSNCIERIDENVFSSLKNLQTLDLSRNQLTSLDPKSFAGLGNLRSLNLKGNKLSYFDLDILDYIKEIVRIDLYGNPIVNKEEILNRFNGSKIKFVF